MYTGTRGLHYIPTRQLRRSEETTGVKKGAGLRPPAKEGTRAWVEPAPLREGRAACVQEGTCS